MSTGVGYVNKPMTGQVSKRAGKIGGFLWHLLQMVIAMEIGMGVYHLVVAVILNPLGYAELRREIPLFTYWIMVLAMVLGMAVFMRWKKMTWRYCLDMTIAMLQPIIGMSILVAVGAMSIQVLRLAGDPAMIISMASFMYFRPHEHANHDASRYTA